MIMKNTLKTILKTCVTLEINVSSAMYLHARRYKLVYPIDTVDSVILHKKGYLVNGKLDDTTIGILTGIEKASANIKSKSKESPYKFVYEHLKAKILPVKLSRSTQATLDKFIPVEGELKEYYKVFLFMFPSNSISKNTLWSRYYGVSYSGYKLRTISKGSVTNFSKIYRSYDPNILLLAAHTMISSSIKKDENKAFIMKISNFMAEWYGLYMEAKELLEEKGDRVFTIVDRSISSNENTILL